MTAKKRPAKRAKPQPARKDGSHQFTIELPPQKRPPSDIPPRFKDSDFVDVKDACCCHGRVHLVGRVECQTIAVGAPLTVQQILSLRAASAAASRPINSEGHARIEYGVTIDKPRDRILLLTTYEISFSAEGGCGPYEWEFRTSGEANTTHACATQQGSFQVATVKRFEDYASRPRGTLDVIGFALDCNRQLFQCFLQLPEP